MGGADTGSAGPARARTRGLRAREDDRDLVRRQPAHHALCHRLTRRGNRDSWFMFQLRTKKLLKQTFICTCMREMI